MSKVCLSGVSRRSFLGVAEAAFGVGEGAEAVDGLGEGDEVGVKAAFGFVAGDCTGTEA